MNDCKPRMRTFSMVIDRHHRFEPRYEYKTNENEVPNAVAALAASGRNSCKIRQRMDQIYVRDVCVYCGATIERAIAKPEPDEPARKLYSLDLTRDGWSSAQTAPEIGREPIEIMREEWQLPQTIPGGWWSINPATNSIGLYWRYVKR